ncbi:MAG: methyltransferase domain-containing protein [Candidatus Pacebacteria bacterium]|nr:methyltransferase domain-containing protein [Candidatus Paceibacterota bacterium]
MSQKQMSNIHQKTVRGFGDEWSRFDQTELPAQEAHELFGKYFKLFPWEKLSANAIGFDMGCGSGRWAKIVADKVHELYCIDASPLALEVARKNLQEKTNCKFIHADFDNIPLADNSMEFGYSLGVLHHIPDTQSGLKNCIKKLKTQAPFLLYIYYAFDNRPAWFRGVWKISDYLRRFVSRTPLFVRYILSQIIALAIYFPLARIAKIMELLGFNVKNFPLAAYKDYSFYSMRTDALDRFGTQLEKRFTAKQIQEMMKQAGLENITFSDSMPYWCAVGYKKD